MKILIRYTLLLLFCLSQLTCSSLPEQTLPDQSVQSLDQVVQSSVRTIESRLPLGSKVAVISFTSPSQGFSDYVLDELAISLSENNHVQVIERQYVEAIHRELGIQMAGDVSDDEIRKVGHQLGAQYVVTGSLVDLGNVYRFRTAVIDVETAVRAGSSSLDIDFNDPHASYLLTGRRIVQPVPPENIAAAPTYTLPVNLSIDGTWRSNTSGIVSVISEASGTCIFTSIDGVLDSAWREAVRRGNVKLGDIVYRNLVKTGNSTWSGQNVLLSLDTYAYIGWADVVLSLDPGGQVLRSSTPNAYLYNMDESRATSILTRIK